MSTGLISIIGSLLVIGAGAFLIEKRAARRIDNLARRRADLRQARLENLKRLEELRENIRAIHTEEVI